MNNNKFKIYKICPYICGALYGVFLGIAIMSFICWVLMWHNKTNGPMEYGEAYVIDTFIYIGISVLALACFAITLIFNIRIFKKTPRTVVNVISEIILPVFTTFPSAVIFSSIASFIHTLNWAI